MPSTISCDVAIVGGGLAGGLIALALKKKKPNCDIRLIEASGGIGGNHLWTFLGSDLAPADRWLAAPLVSHGWTGYTVGFPTHARTIKAPCYAIESERLDRLVRAALPEKALMLRRKAIDVTPTAVALSGGDLVQAEGVIDCRGAGDLSKLDLGWRKSLGRELDLGEAHELRRPILADATIEQLDGYRFAACLPFSATRLFVEDCYYSDTPDLDVREIGTRIDAYVAARGWPVERLRREEAASLPVAMGGDFDGYWESGGRGVAKAGARAGLFHPMTGHGLADAVRLAALIADSRSLGGAALHELTRGAARNAWRGRRFYRMLAAMLFRAADPHERYLVLERFYQLDAELIARFYAARSTWGDRLRVLNGRPVPIGRAVKAMRRHIA